MDTMTCGPLEPEILASLRALPPDEDGSSILPVIIKHFFQQAVEAISEMLALTPRAGELAFVAHRLKGSAMTFGAKRFVEICEFLEFAPADTPPEEIRAVVEALALEFIRVQRALLAEWP